MPYRLDVTDRLHQRLLEIVRTALPLITRSLADADLSGLAHLREEMVEAVELYCRHVHRLLDDARRANSPGCIRDAQQLADGCTTLRGAYEAFRGRWEHRHAADHWHEYRLSAVVMMKRIRAHVEDADGARRSYLSAAA